MRVTSSTLLKYDSRRLERTNANIAKETARNIFLKDHAMYVYHWVPLSLNRTCLRPINTSDECPLWAWSEKKRVSLKNDKDEEFNQNYLNRKVRSYVYLAWSGYAVFRRPTPCGAVADAVLNSGSNQDFPLQLLQEKSYNRLNCASHEIET